jgi:hypothetical protein
MHPAFTTTNDSRSKCTNTTFTAYNNLINPIYASPNNMYCNSDEDFSYCNAGCTNTLTNNSYGIPFYEAVCTIDTSCTNECNIYGERKDSTTTSYTVCEQSSINNCLVLNEYECSLGEYAQGGICVAYNTSGTPSVEKTFRLYPYTELYYLNNGVNLSDCPDVNCSYDENGFWTCPVNTCKLSENRNPNLYKVTYNENTRTLDTTTCNDLGGIGNFNLALSVHGASSTDFVGVDCDYKSITETYTPNSSLTASYLYSGELLNTTKTLNTINVDAYNYQRVSFAINNSDTVFRIVLTDGANTISDLYVTVNVSNSEFVVRRNNATGDLLYTDTFTNPIVTRAVIDLFQDVLNGVQNSQITLYNQLGVQTAYSQGINLALYEDTSASYPYTLQIIPVTNNVILQQVTREKVTSTMPTIYYPIYSVGGYDFVNGYELVGCNYLNDGTYKPRVFISDDVKSGFFDYQDITINKQTIKCTNQIPQTEGDITEGFSDNLKLLLAIIIPALLFLVAIITGFVVESKTMTNICVWGGIFFAVGLVIYFAVIKWIPAWIIIVMLALASLTIVMFFRKLFFQEGNEG